MKRFALAAICAICTLDGQDPLKFEAVSVKPMTCGVLHNTMGPGTVLLKGDPLMVVLIEAFQVKSYQIAGPSWLDTDCFDIAARMPEGASRDQVPAMLQAMLGERFHLVFHREDRPRPVYALVTDKGGPKFKEANLSFRRMGPRPGEVKFRAAAGAQGFQGAMTMAKLAQFLSARLDRPVQDFTGLTGTYDIDLAWTPDPGIDRMSSSATTYATATAEAGDTRTDLPAAPTATLFTALRDALGLRLEARREPFEMLVIDRLERVPTEN